MKRNILFVCVTYYQLILMVQLRLTLFKNDIVSIILHAGRTKNMDQVFSNLKDMKLFDYTYLIKNIDILPENKNPRFLLKRNLQKIIGGTECDELITRNFDEVIFYNLSTFTEVLYAELASQRRDTRFSIIEEGIFSYDNKYVFNVGARLYRSLRRLMGRNNIFQSLDSCKYYCMIPDLVKEFPGEIVSIPSMDTNLDELRKALNNIFGYKNIPINEKYIFFTSVALDSTEMQKIEESFTINLAERLGVDNFILKLHPRLNADTYKEKGISVIENSEIPWEVIQLNLAPSKHILLTTTSGAFVNGVTWTEDIRGLFLFPLLYNKYNNEMREYIQKVNGILRRLYDIGLGSNIRAIESYDQLLN